MKNVGRFVWFDLMTTDAEAGRAFYTDVFGWSLLPYEGGEKPYTMFAVGDMPMGGSAKLTQELLDMGVPPHWMAYCKVEDLDASCALVKELGGQVMAPVQEFPGIGRIAYVADPQKAAFALFETADERDYYDGDVRHGDMTWHELNTTDYEGAWAFYEKLLGWSEHDSFDMGEMGTYFMFKREGTEKAMGGMSNVAKSIGAPPHWLYYTQVDDMDVAIEKITAGGGKVMNGPMEVPGGDRIAQCVDPQGAAFAIVASAK